MQETDKLKLRKPEYNEYADIADINHNMNILDKAVSDKLGKTEKAVDSEKLDGLNSLQFARNYSEANNDIVPREILNNSSHKQSYIGTISYGAEVGLPSSYCKIIYMSHNTNGYGTQIAIPYDSGQYYGILYRQANGNQWLGWCELLDGRDCNQNYPGRIAPGNDANNCLDSGKAYYCIWNQTKNLPLGDNLDDGIIIPYMHIREQYGFQIYMTWNSTAIYWRKKHSGNWSKWYCIGGGSWNQEVIKDSEQVGKYLRWGKYGQSHVIFDASQGIRPDGQPCDSINPQDWWQNGFPTLMGFNGHRTYGVKVSNSGWSDNTGSVQGFSFRNNNGKLEVLIGGEWLQVGGRQYTVTREFDVYAQAESNVQYTKTLFNYSGGSGVIRSIGFDKIILYQPNLLNYGNIVIYVDGIGIEIVKAIAHNEEHFYTKFPFIQNPAISYKSTANVNIEFKNSLSIVSTNMRMNISGVIQTEK